MEESRVNEIIAYIEGYAEGMMKAGFSVKESVKVAFKRATVKYGNKQSYKSALEKVKQIVEKGYIVPDNSLKH